MALYVRKIADIQNVNARLRGGISAGKDLRMGLYGLHGLTLVFTAPVATVTFTTPGASNQEALSLKQILTQINAVVGLVGWATIDHQRRLVIVDPTGAVGVVLDATSTAAASLGFDEDGQAGMVYAVPGGAAPALVNLSASPENSTTYLLITDEV